MIEPEVGAQPIGDWLAELGSAAPAPGGGAAAALNAAIGAGLVEMVANLTVGRPKYAEFEAHATGIGGRAHEVRLRALGLVAEDAAAFGALMAAYRLPKDTDDEKAARRRTVQSSTETATVVPLRIAAAGVEVIELAAELLGRSNPTVVSDLGVAAASAGAAIESAALNVEINLPGLTDEALRRRLADELDGHRRAAARIAALLAAVRREMSR